MCRSCEKTRNQDWRSRNLEDQLAKQKKYYRREAKKQLQLSKDKRFERFGVDRQWYDDTIALQDFRCGICGSKEPRGFGERFAIDHDHSCCGERKACDNCRRGLLSFPCNAALYLIESGWFKQALDYLKKYSTPEEFTKLVYIQILIFSLWISCFDVEISKFSDGSCISLIKGGS